MKDFCSFAIVVFGVVLLAFTTITAPNVLLADPISGGEQTLTECTPGNCDNGNCGEASPPCGVHSESCRNGQHSDCHEESCKCKQIAETTYCECGDINN